MYSAMLLYYYSVILLLIAIEWFYIFLIVGSKDLYKVKVISILIVFRLRADYPFYLYTTFQV